MKIGELQGIGSAVMLGFTCLIKKKTQEILMNITMALR